MSADNGEFQCICHAELLCIWRFRLIHEGSDPNGIRTRVTAVKGRCPGPLDDRVVSAANIGIAVIHARQIGSSIWSAQTCPRFESDMFPHSKQHVALSASVPACEPARLSAR